ETGWLGHAESDSRLGGGGPGAGTLEVGQWRLRQRPLRWLGLRARFVDHVEIGVVAACLFSGRGCGLVQLGGIEVGISGLLALGPGAGVGRAADRKSTRLNSS